MFSRLSSVGPCVHHLSCLSFVEKGVEWLGVIPSIRGGKVCHVDTEAVTLGREEIFWHSRSLDCEAEVRPT